MPLIIAHRGASGYRPEHSRSAYRLALTLGADAVEPDVVLSRDGVPVIRHESNLLHSTDVAARPEFADRRRTSQIDGESVDGFFSEDFDWAELHTLRCREPRPKLRPDSAVFNDKDSLMRLGELLQLLDAHREATASSAGLVIELKQFGYFAAQGRDLVAAVLTELDAHGWSPRDERLYWESFEAPALNALPDGTRRVLLLEDDGRALNLPVADAWDGVSLEVSQLLREPDLASRLHAEGKLLFVWTARPENAFLPKPFRGAGGKGAWGDWRSYFKQLFALNLDGVFVDQPDLGIVARGDVVSGT